MDLFQLKKCMDFKRMMLEATAGGRSAGAGVKAVVGIPIPLGYSDVYVSAKSL